MFKKTEAIRLKKEWDEEIKSKETEVFNLKEKLENYKSAFNFVGLYKVFSELSEKKEKESRQLLISMIVIAVLILSPLVAEIYLLTSGLIKSNSLGVDRLISLIPIISIELILIYFLG